ncbi:TIGR00730 family Rossman fold protein [Nannocystaceae bacterium ST9]
MESQEIRRVCVFAGSYEGKRPEYAALAEALGRVLAQRGLGLVYGGGRVGLMGRLADAALAGGVEVIGVIPEALHRREVGHTGLHELHVVANMHERKAKMAELADAFVVLPGGLGTLEETFEMWTWGQLGFHRKPIGLLDVSRYWTPLIEMLDRMVDEGFVSAEYRGIACVAEQPDALLDQLAQWRAPEVAAWLRARDL